MNNKEQAQFCHSPKLNLPDIVVPKDTNFETALAIEGFHEDTLVPSFLKGQEGSLEALGLPPGAFQEAPSLNYETLRRLDVPFVSKDYQLVKETAEELQRLSALGNEDCRLCNGSGVSNWTNTGSTAKVCKCVRRGASLEQLAKEVVG